MKKYKYFSRINKKKETCGVVEANNKELAITKASIMKQLSINNFTMLFEIEEIK
jgi:hypothetical protein